MSALLNELQHFAIFKLQANHEPKIMLQPSRQLIWNADRTLSRTVAALQHTFYYSLGAVLYNMSFRKSRRLSMASILDIPQSHCFAHFTILDQEPG